MSSDFFVSISPTDTILDTCCQATQIFTLAVVPPKIDHENPEMFGLNVCIVFSRDDINDKNECIINYVKITIAQGLTATLYITNYYSIIPVVIHGGNDWNIYPETNKEVETMCLFGYVNPFPMKNRT